MISNASLVYGLLAISTAVAAAFAHVNASHLNRQLTPVKAPTDYMRWGSKSIDECRPMWQGARGAMLERLRGGEYATACLAISSAIFVFAAARPESDSLAIGLVIPALLLLVFGSVKFANLQQAAKIPAARDTFDVWYSSWALADNALKDRPTQEQTKEAFIRESPRAASTLRRFHVWPFNERSSAL